MIENARRQLLLVAILLIAAVYAVVFHDPVLGLDLKGGTQITYEVDIERAKADGQVPKDADPAQVMRETSDVVYNRIDPTGTLDASVALRGLNGLEIALPGMSDAEATAVEQRIENLGRLEMRVLVTGDYNRDEVTFDLEAEKQRLRQWLDQEGNRDRVAADPLAINLFNNQSSEQGGPNSPHIAWMPQLIRPDRGTGGKSWTSPDPDAIAAYAPGALSTPPVVEDGKQPFLVELMPINMHERHFTGQQMNASDVYAGTDPRSGKPAVFYGMKAEIVDAYAAWTEDYIGKRSAIILNGVVESAPTFISRIPGNGLITLGNSPPSAAAELARVLKTGSLQVRPERQSRIQVGPTLGEKAIQRGTWSMVIGAALVFGFIVWYYRTAGIVAVLCLTLNILFLLAAAIGMRAALTLPGIGGLVLTIGMAVDANILIYERVREELTRGKALLQAVRAGFERAMVTIIDSNLTTFIAGVVLYTVGVGPIRGFAVTLMIGIATTVFTAFFVSRLLYHYLLETKQLTRFYSRGWFTNLNLNFVRFQRPAFIASWIIIGLGLVSFASTPWYQAAGLDFTGGASLRVALKEPITKTDFLAKLRSDEKFTHDFPDPVVNTVGGLDASNRTDEFAVKLKLTPEYAEQVRQAREAAAARGETYSPPYVKEFEAVLGDTLVDDAFDHVVVAPIPDNDNAAWATIRLHFTEPVKASELAEQLVKSYRVPSEGAVEVIDRAGQPLGSEAGESLRVTFEVPPETREDQVFAYLLTPLEGLKRPDGERVRLSSPFPEASEIGGRMVGELQTAAIGSMLAAMFLIVMYVRVRFHEYKYGIGAIVAVLHDVLITIGIVVFCHRMGVVNAEIDMAMIAALLTVVGYSINDTIVIFDRIRENVSDAARLGANESFDNLANQAINQTFSRTVLTTATTLFVVLSQFVVNYGSGSSLEAFSFVLLIGILTGAYSTVFIATPVVLWLRHRETAKATSVVSTDPKMA